MRVQALHRPRSTEGVKMNEQQTAYASMQKAKQELDELDRSIEEELARVKERLDELQGAKLKAGKDFDAAWAAFKNSLGGSTS
jgi:hypothetical protein